MTEPIDHEEPPPTVVQVAAAPTRKGGRFQRALRYALGLIATALSLWLGWMALSAFLDYQNLQGAAEDAAPVGYIGTNFRRTYHNKATRFIYEEDGLKRLWAAWDEAGKPEFYDVDEADFVVERLSGGYGRDSIPGIDYPIFEGPSGEHFKNPRSRQPFYGLKTADGFRGYPAELLRRIEVVNDRDDKGPFAIVFDRSRDEARFYERTLDGKEVTFGTTGYGYGATDELDKAQPLLYDRASRSLWLPEGDSLVCVGGKNRGVKLPQARTPEQGAWSQWVAEHPETEVLMGNDRSQPVPSQ
jgi:hypothetical protein